MMDPGPYYSGCGIEFATIPIVKPNLRTGEGRMKYRPWSAYKQKDQKKKHIVRWPRKVKESIALHNIALI